MIEASHRSLLAASLLLGGLGCAPEVEPDGGPAPPESTPTPAGTATVSGSVETPDGAPVVGLSVSLCGAQCNIATTDAGGVFEFVGIPAGNKVIEPTIAHRDDDDSAENADDDDAAEFSCDGIAPELTELSPDDLDAMLQDKDFQLVNVHIPYAGEIPGTDAHVAYNDPVALETQLDEDVTTKAVLYCQTGPMSAIAGAALIDRGYCRIYDLPAGMVGWEAEGYPIDF